MVERTLAVAVSQSPAIAIEGTFERHESFHARTLVGSDSGGRWGPPGAYPVLYLGRPTASIIVEAYRHLVDDIEGMRPEFVAPRRLVICQVAVSQVLDLRDHENLSRVGLSPEDLEGPHGPCQQVGQAAHQLGLHGILAPAATGLGETLALFERHLDSGELPVLLREERWEHLPADPRRLRVVDQGIDTA